MIRSSMSTAGLPSFILRGPNLRRKSPVFREIHIDLEAVKSCFAGIALADAYLTGV